MKQFTVISSIFLLLISLCSSAYACGVCHSKNPKMVKMHVPFDMVDCMKCHGPGKKLTMDEARSKRTVDKLCADCHVRKLPWNRN